MPRTSVRRILQLAFTAIATLAGPAYGQAPKVPDGVQGCEAIGEPLSPGELFEIAPGHEHFTEMPSGDTFSQRFSLLEDPDATGMVTTTNSQTGESKARYRIEERGICWKGDQSASWTCQNLAPCNSGAVEYVGWMEGGAWGVNRIEETPGARIVKPPVTSVASRPAYDDTLIAPSADWDTADDDHFNGFPGLVGIYLAENADGDAPIINDYLTVQDYSTGQRIDSGQRLVRSLMRIHQPDQDPVQLYHMGLESGTRSALLGLAGKPGDRLDLANASPGVVNLATDEAGEATQDHWFQMRVHIFRTYASWDPATHARPASVRVMSPRGPLFGRSILVCDSAEHARDAVQVTLLSGDQVCRRYDRAHGVTEIVGDKNALQIAAAIGQQEAPMVMQVADISASGDFITLRARDTPSVLLLNTGQFQGWGDWFDRTQGTSRSRSVSCRFPIATAERLANLERGDLLRFRADVESASRSAVILDCSLVVQ